MVAFEELGRKYPEIMDSMTFAQLAAEARKKKALAEGVKLPIPPKVFSISFVFCSYMGPFIYLANNCDP